MTLPDPQRWKRLSPLLDALFELPETAVPERLRALRADDPVLADELERLVGARKQAAGVGFLAGIPGSDESDVAPTLSGHRLGAYTLTTPLGQGGAGTVWRARRADGRFDGEVAIKLLHLSLLGQAAAQRFRREGAILARLTHPHIARLLDAGVSDAGQPYLVLELVEGERIDDYCNARSLPIAQRLALFADVLAAVAHAHSHLVIHRDIKPGNILVDASGSVKLLDFGIAKLIEDDAGLAEASELTRDGGRVLTPEYAAPEQFRGEAVTTATDVYALGVLLYRLLAGRHPTAPEHATAPQVMRAALDTEPVRLSATWRTARDAGAVSTLRRLAAERGMTPARLMRALGGDLENIAARALRKPAAERYATVNAFADDLRRYLAHEPVSARADSFAYRAARFVRRHRGGVAAAVVVAVAVMGGVAGTVVEARRAAQHARQAQAERDIALRELAYAESSQAFVGFLLQDEPESRFTTSELLARGAQMVDRQFSADPGLRARLLLLLSTLYADRVDMVRSVDLLVQAQASARLAGDTGLGMSIDCSMAEHAGESGDFEKSKLLYDAVFAAFARQPDADLGTHAACLSGRGEVAIQRGDAQAALADASAGLTELGATPRPDQRVLAIHLRTLLADARGRLGLAAQAAADYQRALAELTALGRGRTPVAAGLYNNLGVLLARAGQTRRALQTYEDGLAATSERTLQTNRAKLLVGLGRAAEAMPEFERALAAAGQARHPRSIALTSLIAAPAWCATGALDRCAALLETAQHMLPGVVPAGHPTLGSLAMAQAELSLARGDLPAAREGLTRAVAIFDAATEKYPNRIRALGLLARTEQQLGDAALAARDADLGVLRAREMSSGFDSSEWLGNALLAQAVVRRAQGDERAALTALHAALPQLLGALGEDAPATREARALLAQP